eukprot:CAMPEP_0113850806 /NCGR_PEP_ID=MMETSP0372-20130328/4162_1 /TAXON_ID=340204 /ORGANISM="Lankesteria abbotti" /LENGTH=653 /DNA_ID=CAMNT_0000821291 /DNA_START=198 /DNA_END=2159 /DNA_ORIENTATION=- /assembly_acc=CAM_ASM_000359
MKGIVQAVKRRMQKEDRQDAKAAGTTTTPSSIQTASNFRTSTSSVNDPSSTAVATSSELPNSTHVASGGSSSQTSFKPSTPTTSSSSAVTTTPTLPPGALTGVAAMPTAGGGLLPRSVSPPASGSSRSSPGSTPFVRSNLSNSSADKSDDVDGLMHQRVGGCGFGGLSLNAADAIPQATPKIGRQSFGSGESTLSIEEATSSSGGDELSSQFNSANLSSMKDGVTFPPNFVFDGNPFALPPLRDTPENKRTELFRKKVQVCSIVFDFNITQAHQKEKNAKRVTLCELVEYINNNRVAFNDRLMSDVVQMVAANIFRALPPSGSTISNSLGLIEPEDDEFTLDLSWPHLQVVYEFFLRVVVCHDTDPKIAKRYIEQTFILKILELFDSEDPRERDYLKTILHRIYGKIMAMRSFIRKAIQQVFFRSVYEGEVLHGVAELLEILGSIVNGFALPLKEEHKLFLEKSLIPLHKGKNFLAYHQYLAYCMAQYVEKDPRLASVVISGLLKYWPATNTSKEVLFLNEVEEILELTQMSEFQQFMEPLFERLSLCIQSPHFQVSERVLFFWNSDHIVKLINHNRHTIFPLVIKALYRNSLDHWNITVNGLTYNVSKLLAQADPRLFDDVSNRNILSEEERGAEERERNRKWQDLQAAYGK